MKIIKIEKNDKYHEIEVQKSFLWFKWINVYRKIDGHIFRYKSPNIYHSIGLVEYCNVWGLFSIKP